MSIFNAMVWQAAAFLHLLFVLSWPDAGGLLHYTNQMLDYYFKSLPGALLAFIIRWQLRDDRKQGESERGGACQAQRSAVDIQHCCCMTYVVTRGLLGRALSVWRQADDTPNLISFGLCCQLYTHPQTLFLFETCSYLTLTHFQKITCQQTQNLQSWLTHSDIDSVS